MLTINITTIYAIALGAIIFTLIFMKVLYCLAPLKSVVSVLFLKYLYYPYLLDRHRLIGPWTCVGTLFNLIYVAANLLGLLLWATSASEIGRRAGELSLANMVFLFAAQIPFSDILGVSFHTSRKMHRSAAWMSVVLLIIHIVTPILINRIDFAVRDNIFAVIVSYPFL